MVYFASDEGASKIIVRESPRCIKSHFTSGQYLFFFAITFFLFSGFRVSTFVSSSNERSIKLTLLLAVLREQREQREIKWYFISRSSIARLYVMLSKKNKNS